ncbi:MAG: GNAT family N-acetyltransferase [bacterium]|nr:GNAT family N-acetyltransferase [bacterium]
MNERGLVIRVATAADIPNLAGVQLRSALAGFEHIFPESIPKPTQIDLEHEWAELVADIERTVLLAETAGTVVGAVAFGSNSDQRFASDAVLLKLYLLPESAGRGIGSSLYDRAISDLTAAGHHEVFLWVLERNLIARRMYERRGWLLQPWSRTDFPGSGILELGYTLELDYSSAM